MASPGCPAERVPVSCYGKLPVHREYLRIGLGSPGATWIVGLLDDAHAAISNGGYEIDVGSAPALSLAALAPGAGRLVAGIARQSSDALRKHPVSLFVESTLAGDHEQRWHLLPLALRGVWEALQRLLARSFATLDELAGALTIEAEAAWDAAEHAYREGLTRVADLGPWHALTGARGTRARHMALNFLAIAEAQRSARSVDEGVAVALPMPEREEDAALGASLWLDVWRTEIGRSVLPTIIVGGTPPRLYTFYRPVAGRDLGPLLAGALPVIDELGEEWQTLPGEGSPWVDVLDRIVAEGAAPLGDLLARLKR